jgi:hypothetical protein
VGEVSFFYEENWLATALCIAVYPLSLYLTRSYEVQPEASSAQNLRRSLLGLLFATIATPFIFYLAPAYRFARGIFFWRQPILCPFPGHLAYGVLSEPAPPKSDRPHHGQSHRSGDRSPADSRILTLLENIPMAPGK